MSHQDDLIRLTLRQLEARRLTRRRFLGRAGLTAGGFVLAPSLLAACGDDEKTSSGDGGKASESSSKTLRISNWPEYIDEETIPAFEKATGLKVNYKDDVNDNEEYFAKVREPLSRGDDIGADLFVVTDFLVARLINLKWLAELDDGNIPNKKNLVDELSAVAFDEERRFSLPWFSGFTGLAYNEALTGREITSMDDLFDPEFKGQVSMFADMRDGLGMVIQHQGGSIEEASPEDVQKAADRVQEAKDAGQIRRFTGNDYLDDLTAGNLAICQAYSGDVAQAALENPDLKFVLPESGGILFSDNMVVPTTTKNGEGAEQWMNFVYDPKVMAPLTAYVQFIPPVKGTGEELEKIDAELAANPLINPPDEMRELAKVWRPLSDEEEVELADIYARVTTG